MLGGVSVVPLLQKREKDQSVDFFVKRVAVLLMALLSRVIHLCCFLQK